jgi:hypothetical protein
MRMRTWPMGAVLVAVLLVGGCGILGNNNQSQSLPYAAPSDPPTSEAPSPDPVSPTPAATTAKPKPKPKPKKKHSGSRARIS